MNNACITSIITPSREYAVITILLFSYDIKDRSSIYVVLRGNKRFNLGDVIFDKAADMCVLGIMSIENLELGVEGIKADISREIMGDTESTCFEVTLRIDRRT